MSHWGHSTSSSPLNTWHSTHNAQDGWSVNICWVHRDALISLLLFRWACYTISDAFNHHMILSYSSSQCMSVLFEYSSYPCETFLHPWEEDIRPCSIAAESTDSWADLLGSNPSPAIRSDEFLSLPVPLRLVYKWGNQSVPASKGLCCLNMVPDRKRHSINASYFFQLNCGWKLCPHIDGAWFCRSDSK